MFMDTYPRHPSIIPQTSGNNDSIFASNSFFFGWEQSNSRSSRGRKTSIFNPTIFIDSSSDLMNCKEYPIRDCKPEGILREIEQIDAIKLLQYCLACKACLSAINCIKFSLSDLNIKSRVCGSTSLQWHLICHGG